MYQFKRIRHAGPGCTTQAELDELGAKGWYPAFQYLGYFTLLMRRTDGNGNVDLTEVWNAIDGLEGAIESIRQERDQIWKAIDECGGGVNPGPSEFDFDVWCCPDGAPAVIAKSGAVKDKFGVVFGPTLSARFTIKEGTAVSAGLLYIVPEPQPTGYCHYFHGVARQECEKHGFTMMGEAEWHRRNEFGGGKWGIRLKFPNIDVVQAYYQNHEYVRLGGALYAEKGKPPLGAFGANAYHVTIPFT